MKIIWVKDQKGRMAQAGGQAECLPKAGPGRTNKGSDGVPCAVEMGCGHLVSRPPERDANNFCFLIPGGP